MRDNFVFFPLIILIVIALFSLFIGTGELNNGFAMTVNNPEGYPFMYDYTGYPIVHFGNFSKYDETDNFPTWQFFDNVNGLDNIPNGRYMLWTNESVWSWSITGYYAYYTPDGNASAINSVPMTSQEYTDFKDTFAKNKIGATGDLSTTYGIIIIAISMLVVAGVVGINFFGSGENEKSTQFILTVVSLLSIWGIFSVISLFWLSQFIYGFGNIFYFALTAIFCIGLFMKGTE